MSTPEPPKIPKGPADPSRPFFIPPNTELQLEHPFFSKSREQAAAKAAESGESVASEESPAATGSSTAASSPVKKPEQKTPPAPAPSASGANKPRPRFFLWGAIAALAIANVVQFSLTPSTVQAPGPTETTQAAVPTAEPSSAPAVDDVLVDEPAVTEDLTAGFWASDAGEAYQRVVTSVTLEVAEDGGKTAVASTRIIAPESGDDTEPGDRAVGVCSAVEEYLVSSGEENVAVDVQQLSGDIYVTNSADGCTVL